MAYSGKYDIVTYDNKFIAIRDNFYSIHIGGPEEVRALIEDLQTILKTMEKDK